MALDVYVGPLTRYYAGDWQSIEKKPARARDHGERDCSRIHTAVMSWRGNLAEALASHLSEPMAWDETPAAPWFAGRPDWTGFGSLVLWAAYAEQPGLRRPATLPEEWDDDPALVRSNAAGFRSRYSHLVRNVEIWLPCPFDFTFEGDDVDGRRVLFGSAVTLGRQLAELNAATWKMTDEAIARLGARPATDGGSLEFAARQAMAVMTGLAQRAVQHRLPMKLDY